MQTAGLDDAPGAGDSFRPADQGMGEKATPPAAASLSAGLRGRGDAATPALGTDDRRQRRAVPSAARSRLDDPPGRALQERVEAAIDSAGGWLSFDRLMAIALYEPHLGYYARGDRQFGPLPSTGSDFITAPELSPLFGAALARPVAQILEAAGADTVFEFGAGSGALAEQLIDALGGRLRHYAIVDISGVLRERQAARLARFGSRVTWLDRWPDAMHGVVVGNEVLDAMPVQLLHRVGDRWLERGVCTDGGGSGLVWADRPTALRPPIDGLPSGSVTEIHSHAVAWVRTLAERLQRGAAFLIDYGFPESEYYHPQRSGGTLMCHRAHRADTDPLTDLGDKDITAHIDFTAIALAGQEAGLDVLGYTSQARFLMNCGLLDLLGALPGADARATAAVQMLLNEHEMGELFKVIGFGKGVAVDPPGFGAGDRSHTL